MAEMRTLGSVYAYISVTLRTIPDVVAVWLLPSPGPDIHLATVSDRFSGPEYPEAVQTMYALAWTMPRPVPPVVLHVLDVDEWQGWRGQEIRECGQLLYEAV